MTLELERLPLERAYILQNIYPVYLHELSAYMDVLPNDHGLFESDEITRYDPETFLKIWWKHPNQLFPYLIKVDGKPAGFVFITTPPFIEGEGDYEILEFFLMNPYRGKGLAAQAAIQALNQFHGQWKFVVLPRNKPALQFWRKVLEKVTGLDYQETLEQTPVGEMVMFRFKN